MKKFLISVLLLYSSLVRPGFLDYFTSFKKMVLAPFGMLNSFLIRKELNELAQACINEEKKRKEARHAEEMRTLKKYPTFVLRLPESGAKKIAYLDTICYPFPNMYKNIKKNFPDYSFGPVVKFILYKFETKGEFHQYAECAPLWVPLEKAVSLYDKKGERKILSFIHHIEDEELMINSVFTNQKQFDIPLQPPCEDICSEKFYKFLGQFIFATCFCDTVKEGWKYPDVLTKAETKEVDQGESLEDCCVKKIIPFWFEKGYETFKKIDEDIEAFTIQKEEQEKLLNTLKKLRVKIAKKSKRIIKKGNYYKKEITIKWPEIFDLIYANKENATWISRPHKFDQAFLNNTEHP